MAFNRETLSRRIADAVQHGFSTHRVQNKIFYEVAMETANAVLDIIEAELNKPIEISIEGKPHRKNKDEGLKAKEGTI